jgi:hypothetical protein
MQRARAAISLCGLTVLFVASSISVVAGTASATSGVGNVQGTFRMVGGPNPGFNKLVSGVVDFSPAGNNHSKSVKVVVGSSGKFTARISVGIWRVSGRTPYFDDSKIPCDGGRIVVTTAKTVHESVQCDLP